MNQHTRTDYDGPGSDARQSIAFDDGNLDTIHITGDMNCDGAFDGGDGGLWQTHVCDAENRLIRCAPAERMRQRPFRRTEADVRRKVSARILGGACYLRNSAARSGLFQAL